MLLDMLGRSLSKKAVRCLFMAMKHVLFLFLDGVGLGVGDRGSNPFAQARMPNLNGLLDGRRLLQDLTAFSTERVSFIPADACLGVVGMPQSASGQGAILAGINVPRCIGKHWGPKPNAEIRTLLHKDNLFKHLRNQGVLVGMANAYPPAFFRGVESGRRALSSIQFAVTSAGVKLSTESDLRRGRAFAADFTGESWRSELGFEDTPILNPEEAGQGLARAARDYGLLLFDCWLTDVIGHRGSMDEAVSLLERLDEVLGGILNTWHADEGLFFIASDHGNLEDKSTRRHTHNPVPVLIMGKGHQKVAASITDISDISPALLSYLRR